MWTWTDSTCTNVPKHLGLTFRSNKRKCIAISFGIILLLVVVLVIVGLKLIPRNQTEKCFVFSTRPPFVVEFSPETGSVRNVSIENWPPSKMKRLSATAVDNMIYLIAEDKGRRSQKFTIDMSLLNKPFGATARKISDKLLTTRQVMDDVHLCGQKICQVLRKGETQWTELAKIRPDRSCYSRPSIATSETELYFTGLDCSLLSVVKY